MPRHLDTITHNIIGLFSGSIVPLWFFPDALEKVSYFLPFRLIYFVPISVYLNKAGFFGSINLIMQQFIWIISLHLLMEGIWKLGIKKLVVQGG